MLKYTAWRILQTIPTFILVAVILFLLARLIPGDPAENVAGPEATQEEISRLRQDMGLNASIPEQFATWVTALFRGDLGTSLITGRPVSEVIASAVAVTAVLAAGAMTVSLILGIPMAVTAAMKQGRVTDKTILIGSLLGISVPSFVLGLVLILVFAVWLGWLPASGFSSMSAGLMETLRVFILPSLSLGMLYAANIARTGRASTLEVLSQDYIVTARALGLRERSVRYRHALKNAMIPILSVVGVTLGTLLGGTVVTEKVFNLPGMGTVVINALLRRDYPVIQAVVILIVAVYLVVNLLVDLAYAVIDPRVRYGQK